MRNHSTTQNLHFVIVPCLRRERVGGPLRQTWSSNAAETDAALTYARAQDVPISVRSGGHGISGNSTNDGGIVIHLEALDGVEVIDRERRLVRVGARSRRSSHRRNWPSAPATSATWDSCPVHTD
ncbi:FAD-binding protein [Streptomyces sp. NPDC002758]